MRKVVGIAMVGTMALCVVARAPVAFANQGASRSGVAAVTTTGTCSATSTWALTLKHDSGRIESDLEVQTPTAGQTWHFVMKDNSVRFGRGNKVTRADGSFSATRYAPNQTGTDNIVAKATNATTGEVCQATGSI